MNIYPLKLGSVLKNIIWGGTLLSEKYGKGNKGEKIAEAWVLALRGDGTNVIENGEYAGMSLEDYASTHTLKNLCGKDFDAFPLLIKLIDAHDNLSVQVHPDDKYAHANGYDSGKTEMWYIVDASDDARLVYGMKENENLSGEQIRASALDGTLEDHLNYVPVKPGDVFFIPAGLVHAIGSGILIAEIQQNSNTTFRMYDYNRKDKDGKTRELHIDKAIDVICNDKRESGEKEIISTEEYSLRVLADCEFFKVEKADLYACKKDFNADIMTSVLCIDGDGCIEYDGKKYPICRGESYLLPAGLGEFSVSTDKKISVIFSYAK